jgi:thioredoxin reductase
VKSRSSAKTFDVVIIGGGPAGLSAALVLGRSRRTVFVSDSGHPRNKSSKAMHGFLSRDGMPPSEFLRISRKQLLKYPSVCFKKSNAVKVTGTNGSFKVSMSDGATRKCRKLLLATGISDDLPKIPGLKSLYGTAVHHCPYCDGWEHRDRPLAVLGANKETADLAVELLQWSKDITICTNGPARFSKAENARFCDLGIQIITERVLRLEGRNDKLRSLRFAGRSDLVIDALFFSPKQGQCSNFGEKLGCKLEKDGSIQCNEDASTCVKGIFAAGNAGRGLQLVIMAAAKGTQAAFSINQELISEDFQK